MLAHALLVHICICICISASSATSGNETSRLLRDPQAASLPPQAISVDSTPADAVVCYVREVIATLLIDGNLVQGPLNPEDSLICFIGDLSYRIRDLPPQSHNDLDLQHPNKSYLHISRAVVDKENSLVQISSDATVTVGGPPVGYAGTNLSGHRKLAPSMETDSVLILRVTNQGVSPNFSAAQLSGYNFANTGNASLDAPVNTVSQYAACSFGKLKLIPGTYTSATSKLVIKAGVAEIDIGAFNTTNVFTMDNAVITAANSMAGTSVASLLQNIMIDLPNNGYLFSGNTWISYAYLGSWKSVFNDEWAGRLSTTMHELGHNYGLLHSGKGTDPYGDMTGYMGYASYSFGAPSKCFNAQKNWLLGWFDDRKLQLTASDLPWGGNLTSFVDYDLAGPGQNVVLAVTRSDLRLFMQINSAKKFNYQTVDQNQVIIVQDGGYSVNQSWLQANLSLSYPVYTAPSFNGTFSLVVTLCDLQLGSPDFAFISLHLDDGVQTNTCTKAILSSSPTKKPTKSPTQPPTLHPTNKPPSKPTLKPTGSPTDVPIKQPKKKPTRAPTTKPTASPTHHPTLPPPPTKAPTGHPTKKPTSNPSSRPTSKPSSRPTSKPTYQPTIFPTQRPSKQPIRAPTTKPTASPTHHPTLPPPPTKAPTGHPTKKPTSKPTYQPTIFPTQRPSKQPTKKPTRDPTTQPTTASTKTPTFAPTHHPIYQPRASPTHTPSALPCVDWTCYFPVPGQKRTKNCAWLAKNWGSYVYSGSPICTVGDASYDICIETCGRCGCYDSAYASFVVNSHTQDCQWLFNQKHPTQRSVCVPGSDPYYQCARTCGACTP